MVHGKAPSGSAFDAWKAFFTAGFAAPILTLFVLVARPVILAFGSAELVVADGRRAD